MRTEKPDVCVICRQAAGPSRLGNFYDALAANGMRLEHFWVCNDCAIPLGPGQGGKSSETSRG